MRFVAQDQRKFGAAKNNRSDPVLRAILSTMASKPVRVSSKHTLHQLVHVFIVKKLLIGSSSD